MLKDEELPLTEPFGSPSMEFHGLISTQELLNNIAPDGLFTISDIEDNMLLSTDVQMSALQEQQEDTMDAATKYNPGQLVEFLPVMKMGPPERRVFAGTLDFQVEINASDTHKNKYLYSSLLNRIYVAMGIDFSVQFRWDYTRSPRPMCVRATVVFSDEAQAEKRVERCTQHTHDVTNADLNMAIVKNVLRSSRELTAPGTYYSGLPDRADSWFSVLVEFPVLGAGPWTHAYKFVCKNSCSSGINRRAIDIIFELEDSVGTVVGRQVVGARACACPRRDLRRDEDAEGVPRGKKRVVINTASPSPAAPEHKEAKRLKVEVVDGVDDLYSLPQVEVVGVRAMLAGLSAMLAVMEHDAAVKRNDPAAVEKYTTAINKLKAKIEHYKNIKPSAQ